MDIRQFFGLDAKVAKKQTPKGHGSDASAVHEVVSEPSDAVISSVAPLSPASVRFPAQPARRALHIIEEDESEDNAHSVSNAVTEVSTEEPQVRSKRKEGPQEMVPPSPKRSKTQRDEQNTPPDSFPSALDPDLPAKGGPTGPGAVAAELNVAQQRPPTSSYRSFLSRGGPPRLGQKEIPVGARNCLAGKKFLITGVLDSISREQAEELIRHYGGDIAKSVVKKLDYAVVGTEPGAAKLEKINSQRVKTLSEDDLFHLISSSRDVAPSGEPQSTPSPTLAPDTFSPITTPQRLDAQSVALMDPSRSMPLPDVVPGSGELLADKYRPNKLAELIGYTATEQNPVHQLRDWLHYWAGRSSSDTAPPTKQRGCLLTGPPGIGKTTAATFLARECGFSVIQLNASDTRSKSSLRDTVSHSLNSHGLTEFFGSTKKTTLLIMDEVDGMSTGDRGGLAELGQLIQTTKFPIICIANDKYRVRSLKTHCMPVTFRRPTAQQIQAKLAQIAFREGITASESVRRQLAEESHGDVRQAINLLQLWSIGGTAQISLGMNRKKDPSMGPFDAVPPLLSDSGRFEDKLGRFFVDYSLVPLFVHENYLSIKPDGGLSRLTNSALRASKQKGPVQPVPSRILDSRTLQLFGEAADSISLGDLLERGIRREQHWELLPAYGTVSSIRPCATLKGRFVPGTNSWSGGGLQFPQWLGKNSSTTKRQRLLKELQSSVTVPTAGTNGRSLRLDYCSVMHHLLTAPLAQSGADGIPAILSMMEAYSMQKDSRDSVLELTQMGKDQKDIPSNIKSALTRAINKSHWVIASTGVAKKLNSSSLPSSIVDPELGTIFETDVLGEEEEEDGVVVENNRVDRLIKEKKPSVKVSNKSKK